MIDTSGISSMPKSRRWLMPSPRISLKEFRTLLLRRSKALSLLPSSSSAAAANPAPSISTPPPPPPQRESAAAEDFKGTGNPNSSPAVSVKLEDAADCEVKPLSPPLDQVASLIDGDKAQVAEKEKENGEVVTEENPALEGNNKLDNADDKEERKREVEEKLKILNEKKHNLVQALKQILNAEEELKRRSCMLAGQPPLPLQMDASNDLGSMTRHATPRTGSEANVTDIEGGEGDDALNYNPRSRPLPRMNSTSPSAESALRRPPHFQPSVVSYPSRAAMVAAGSPSRFAPSGNQGHPSNLLTVSVSGTTYVASSPSPAASGGTSGFRDARHPSPWN